VTYGQAHVSFRAFADVIRTRDWGGDDNRIAVSTNDPAELLFTIWACLYSGTSLVFVPRSADDGPLRAAMQASGARTLLTDIASLGREEWVVSLKEIFASLAGNAVRVAGKGHEVSVRTEAAFLFQTSGTEGEPKWVRCHFWKCFEAVECMWREGALQHAREQNVFLTPPLYHSYGLSSMLEYTRGGSTLVLPSGSSPLGPVGELGNRDLAERVTAIEGVPYFYSQFSRLAGRFRLPALRHLGFGGGGLDLDAVERLRKHYPEITYSVRYGLTETPSVVSHKFFCPPYDADWRSSGRIMPVYGVDIVDTSGNSLGPEQEGEIAVMGQCVADYIGAECRSSEYIFRTGDIGYLTREGELVVVGRRSVFLKYRGFRLSPEQIESVIYSFSGVEDCRVSMQDARLIAEVVSSSQSLSKHSLLNYLLERLPAYAVPEDVIQVERIPRTPSGKIKRY
jgi:acyl-coenzyme A synthetase/AMP-(fatty) acid ligase